MATAAAVAAVSGGGVTAWAVVSSCGIRLRGVLEADSDHSRAVGQGLYLALDALLSDSRVNGHGLDLWVASAEHRALVAGVVDGVGVEHRIVVQHGRGSLARAAETLAATLIPGARSRSTRRDPPKGLAGAHRRRDQTPRRVVVATDGSVGGRTIRERGAGISWVNDQGRYGTSACASIRSPVTAELAAILLAIEAHQPRRPLQVISDSRQAVCWVRHMLTGGTAGELSGTTVAQVSLLRRIEMLCRGRDVQVSWVKGHAANELNLAADRLAVAARRADQLGQPAELFRRVQRHIVDEMSQKGRPAVA